MNLARYHAANLPELIEKINRNSIGMDDYLNRFWDGVDTTSNYPPYNIIEINNVESRLEVALAGFKKDELKVFTEFGKLHVQGTKEKQEDDRTFRHRGVAARDFTRVWSLSDDTEIRGVEFRDGLLVVQLGKIVPEHHARKDFI
jgi:HSP20 family molecular chaperone IbpA|tara:strand:+ start:10961 stop:11392 length:432 start_codon:yes stop_codon:yes gene_type:complete